jgi:hypothetical protein
MLLNENSILETLQKIVDYLKAGDLDQAEAHLDALGFDRLLSPIRDRSKGSRRFFDPAEPFDSVRVHETGDHLHSCFAAVKRGDAAAALTAGEHALERWQAGGG